MSDLAKNRVLETRRKGILPHERHVVGALPRPGDHFPSLLVENLKLHIRLGIGNGFQPRQEEPLRDAVRRDNPHTPFTPPAPGGIIGQSIEVLASDGREFPPGLRDFQPPALPADQFNAEERFQFADLPTHQRLAGRIPLLDDSSDGSGICDRAEVRETVHRESGLGEKRRNHNYGVILCANSAICKFCLPAYGEDVKENDIETNGSAKGGAIISYLAENTGCQNLGSFVSGGVNKELEIGRGCKLLGLAGEAKAEFEKVPASDPDCDLARAELMTLLNHWDVTEQDRKADEGLRLIRSGSRLPILINETALRLQFAGRVDEAYDLTREMTRFLDSDAADNYGMACYASQIEKWKEAAEAMLSGLQKDPDLTSDFKRMFSDLDLELLYHHAAEGKMDIETAYVLADPLFAAALSKLAGCELDFDGILLRELPWQWLEFVKQDLVQGVYFLSPQAPHDVQTQFRAWLLALSERIASRARRGIERAQKMIVELQFGSSTGGAFVIVNPKDVRRVTPPAEKWRASTEGWRVMVSDNFDFMDEDEPASCHGSYSTYEEALAEAKGIVEASIRNSQGSTADEIYDHYMSFGDDAFILAPAGTKQPEPLFSSWNYAKELTGIVAK